MLVEFESGSVLHGPTYVESRAVTRLVPMGDSKTSIVVGGETVTVMGPAAQVAIKLENARLIELYGFTERLQLAIELGTQGIATAVYGR